MELNVVQPMNGLLDVVIPRRLSWQVQTPLKHKDGFGLHMNGQAEHVKLVARFCLTESAKHNLYTIKHKSLSYHVLSHNIVTFNTITCKLMLKMCFVLTSVVDGGWTNIRYNEQRNEKQMELHLEPVLSVNDHCRPNTPE